MTKEGLEYVGFWPRVGASILDTLIVLMITAPLLIAVYGRSYFTRIDSALLAGPADFLISWVFPAVLIILFWIYRQATPGKMAISAKVVDAETGGPISTRQSIVRYLGYFVSVIPLFLGILWVAIDSKKQGWHDKLAGTVVVRPRHDGVKFRN